MANSNARYTDDMPERFIGVKEFWKLLIKQREKNKELPNAYAVNIGINQAVGIMNNLPAADVVPVVHGRWVLAKPRVKGRNATYRCTVCGKLRSSYYNDVFQWEYCPCGAKMDLNETEVNA